MPTKQGLQIKVVMHFQIQQMCISLDCLLNYILLTYLPQIYPSIFDNSPRSILQNKPWTVNK